MAENRMDEVRAANVGSTIYNHEVSESCPPIITVNQQVTKLKFVASFICTQMSPAINSKSQVNLLLSPLISHYY